jgi:predicted DCC family thiol-disulfide oxidoreductase YuxK
VSWARLVYHALVVAGPSTPPAIVLFDGVCNLCNASVQFIIDRDPGATMRFAALQSPEGRRILAGFGHPAVDAAAAGPETIVLVEGGRVYDRSTAALRIARRLRAPWPLLAVMLVVPRALRDLVYRWAAARRYRWFGKTDACRVPTPELKARFLD